jgi:hypothetical protein
MEQINNVSREPLVEILREFSMKHHLLVGNHGNSERVLALSSIIGTSHSTVDDWFKKFTVPTGIRMCKLNLLLSLCGFETVGRKDLTPLVRVFSDTFATVVTLEEATKELGVSASNLLIWLRGDTQPKQTQQVIDFNQKYAEKRLAKTREWKRLLEDKGFAVPSVTFSDRKSFDSTQIVPQPPFTEQGDSKLADQMLIHLMQTLSISINMGGVLSDENRKKAIRQAVGHAEIANLIGSLQKLSMASFNLS